MAEKQLLLEVVTPDRMVLSTEADVVVCPGVEGQFGVLVGHIPFLSALDIGEMYYKAGGKTEYLAVSGGFAEVTGEKVTDDLPREDKVDGPVDPGRDTY